MKRHATMGGGPVTTRYTASISPTRRIHTVSRPSAIHRQWALSPRQSIGRNSGRNRFWNRSVKEQTPLPRRQPEKRRRAQIGHLPRKAQAPDSAKPNTRRSLPYSSSLNAIRSRRRWSNMNGGRFYAGKEF